MPTSQAHGTEVGFRYAFVEYTEIAVAGTGGLVSWMRTVAPDQDPKQRRMVRSRWIYALCFQDRPRPTLVCELYIDDRGQGQSRPGAVCLRKEPDDRGEGTLAQGLPPLPRTSNGAPTYWVFVASRIRLACASLRQLCRFERELPDSFGNVFASANGVYLPVVDPASKDCQFQISDSPLPALPVIDFLTLGEQLARQYQRACDDHLREIVPLASMTAAERKQLQRRVLTCTLAKLVEPMVEHDASLARKIRVLELFRWIKTYDDTLAQLKAARERAARQLGEFHGSAAMTMVEGWYRQREPAIYHLWIDYAASVFDRMDQSVMGFGYLDDPPPMVRHILESYAFPIARPPKMNTNMDSKKWSSVVKKSAAAVTAIWSKFVPWYLERRQPSSPANEGRNDLLEESIERMNQVLEDDVLFVQVLPEGIKVAVREDALESAVKRAADSRRRIATTLQLGVDSINSAFKLAAFIGKPSAETTIYDRAEAASAINSVLKGFVLDKLKDSSEARLARFGEYAVRASGLVSAAADALNTYRDVKVARSDGDLTAAVMSGVSGSAAVLSGLATMLALSNPYLLMSLFVIQAAGLIGSIWFRDDRLENFLEHCTFGTQFGRQDARPAWADGSYRDWCDREQGLERQLNTLYNLITTFTLKAYNPVTVDMQLGYYDQDMEVRAQFFDGKTIRKLNFYPSSIPFGQEAVVGDGGVRWLGGRKGRATAFRLTFDRDWRYGHSMSQTACRVQINRTVTMAGQTIASVIPQGLKKLSDDEVRRFGGLSELVKEDAGVAYPLAGLTQPLNPETKSSS